VNEIDLEKARREEIRWRILKVLDAGRPLPVAETLILTTLQDVSMPVSPHSLRRELDYLVDRKLVTVTSRETPTWTAQLTHYGVDIVEYTVDCFPGIARPKKWY
jgi:Fe2+ or Zn2+ uptake regulation protein